MRGEYTRVGAKIGSSTYGPGPGTLPLPLTPVPLYLRIVATISSWLSLAGYTLFALIFTSARDNVRLSRPWVVALAAALLTAGYLGAAVTLALSRRALRVQYNVVLLPFLLTSVGGLIEIVLNHSLHESFPVGKGSAYIYGPLVTASLTTIAFGLLSFMAYWQMHGERQRRHCQQQQQQQQIQPMDINISNKYNNTTPAYDGGTSPLLREDSSAIHLNHINSNNNNSSSRPYARYEMARLSPSPGTSTTGAPIAPPATTTDINDMIPSDEAQRRQLLRLLLAREQDYSRQDAASRSTSTYHIDWPGSPSDGGDDSPSAKRQQPLLSAAVAVAQQQQQQQPRNLSVPDLPAASSSSMPRRNSESSTSISNQWDMGNLLGEGRRRGS